MTVNAIVLCRDVPDQPSPCVLALGDNTSAIGWLYRSSRLHQPHHAVHLQIARHLAHEMIQNDCCLYSQHIPGARNIIADLLSYDGQGRDKPHPIAHDQPDDATLTSRFHASPHYSSQITSNFRISPLPPDIDSWLRRTLQTLESYALVELSSPSSPPTEPGGDGAATVVNSETPMTPHWTDYQNQHDNSLPKPLPNASDMPFGTQTATHSLIASVRERYYRGLSDKPSASWQRRVGGWTDEPLPQLVATPCPPSRYRSTPPLVFRTGSSDVEAMRSDAPFLTSITSSVPVPPGQQPSPGTDPCGSHVFLFRPPFLRGNGNTYTGSHSGRHPPQPDLSRRPPTNNSPARSAHHRRSVHHHLFHHSEKRAKSRETDPSPYQ